MAYEVHLLPGQSINNFGRVEELETFVGALKASELVKRCQIPHRDYEGDTGYQRLPTQSRVDTLANEMLSRDISERMVDLPTSLLLSVRDRNLRPHLESTGRYVLTLPANGAKPFYVVDGQHRIAALRTVIEDGRNEFWSNYRVPVVIFFGADETVEMIHFHTVNSNAKSIRSDLDLDLLEKRAQGDDEFLLNLPRKQAWKVHAQRITALAAKQGVWIGRIRFPNQPKGTTLVTSNSFAFSLKPALAQVHFTEHTPENRAKIVDAYWRGIEKALPECFRTPKRYNIQKSVGVYVFHELLSIVLRHAETQGNPIFSPNSYAGILDITLRGLRGVNLKGDEAVGPDFWKSGAEGVAGVYSSGSGRQRLVNQIGTELQANWRG